MKIPKIKTKVISKAKHPGGLRYDKTGWLEAVTAMLAQGQTYAEIAKALGVGASTVCRYAWETRLVSHLEHRNTTRAIIKAAAKHDAKAEA